MEILMRLAQRLQREASTSLRLIRARSRQCLQLALFRPLVALAHSPL